jgi:SAM-dependent methyltransferase
MDHVLARPLAYLGDHLLYRFRRTGLPVPEGRELELLGLGGLGETADGADRADKAARRDEAERVDQRTYRSARPPVRLSAFRTAYGAHRASEGRGLDSRDLMALPYLTAGPLARQWSVRARTFEAFLRAVAGPDARRLARPLRVLDLGAGNAWLCYRLALAGHDATALDLRTDTVDGLGAAREYLRERPGLFGRVAASFDALPLGGRRFDLAVFNAALHYALDLPAVLREACRVVRAGGRVVILDSPFYADAAAGEAMVAEKHRDAAATFGGRAGDLLALPFVEFLTADRLRAASAGLRLTWRRHRVRYPLWYEARALAAWFRRRRAPSRFDVWECTVP